MKENFTQSDNLTHFFSQELFQFLFYLNAVSYEPRIKRFFSDIIYILKMIPNHQGINKFKWIVFDILFTISMNILYHCWVFFCWWVILYINFDRYVLISKLILIILCLYCFDRLNQSLFSWFFAAIIYIVKMILGCWVINKGNRVLFYF